MSEKVTLIDLKGSPITISDGRVQTQDDAIRRLLEEILLELREMNNKQEEEGRKNAI